LSTDIKHETWSSRWVFILAATGSAVGLGNIWRFPYVTGENGGGAFVLVYLLCVLLVGLPVMICEVMLGRHGRASPINAMKNLANRAKLSEKWSLVGLLGIMAGFLILSFYSVIAGWSLAYTFYFVTGTMETIGSQNAENFFSKLTESAGSMLIWHSIFLAITCCMVGRGLKRGLEMAVKSLMPILFLMLFGLVCYSGIVGHFGDAIDYLFTPNFSVLTGKSILMALGQAFFSLSLGMGSLMIYGAYLPTQTPIIRTSAMIALADTLVALSAGLAIFPIVFAYGLEAGQGPGLVFVTLTVAFGAMPFGQILGTIFFVLLSIAAWTSAISLLEPIVAWLLEGKGLTRVKATVIGGGGAWFLGVFSLLSFNHWNDIKVFGKNFFEISEFLSTSIMLPLGGLLIVLFSGWRLKSETVLEWLGIRNEERRHFTRVFLILVKIVAPLGVAAVLFNSSGIKKIVFETFNLIF